MWLGAARCTVYESGRRREENEESNAALTLVGEG